LDDDDIHAANGFFDTRLKLPVAEMLDNYISQLYAKLLGYTLSQVFGGRACEYFHHRVHEALSFSGAQI